MSNDVLIPRGETEELVSWIIKDFIDVDETIDIIDIGSGSGAIAVTLSLELPTASVSAVDISCDALNVARKNSISLGAKVQFSQMDILSSEPLGEYDVIVSNPPYVTDSEKRLMRNNVLKYEPHIALFVDDNNPLLFYRRIADIGCRVLRDGGRLYFEINENYSSECCDMLHEMGYIDIVLKYDLNDKPRMVRASKGRRLSYDEALKKIMSVPMFQKVGAAAFAPTLDGINRLVDRLGNPQRCYKTIHIAGTNGKGSVSNMLSSVLMEAGYKVGCYTSPHLIDYRERVMIDGVMVDKEVVAEFTSIVGDIIDKYSPSFFEITTALAFYAFKCELVDIAIIETGLGGLTDSTNIISPVLSVITNISFDHKALLGDSLGAIAEQKGGIIKPLTPVVIGERGEESDEVFNRIASSKKSKIYFAEDYYVVDSFDNISGEITVNKGDESYYLGLRGECQRRNFVTLRCVVDALRERGIEISNSKLSDGVANVCKNLSFRGRWQQLSNHPIVICDTAHNRAGIEQIVAHISKMEYERLYLVLGFMEDKEVEDILSIMPRDAKFIFVTTTNPRSMKSERIFDIAQKMGLDGIYCQSVLEGVNMAKAYANPNDMIFIGGSTFTVADVLVE